MTEPVIELDGVDKTYRFFRLSDVRLRLEAGQIMGFVGPNGAGKSTTIRILMAMVRPDRGTVRVLGRDLHPHRIRQNAVGQLANVGRHCRREH